MNKVYSILEKVKNTQSKMGDASAKAMLDGKIELEGEDISDAEIQLILDMLGM